MIWSILRDTGKFYKPAWRFHTKKPMAAWTQKVWKKFSILWIWRQHITQLNDTYGSLPQSKGLGLSIYGNRRSVPRHSIADCGHGSLVTSHYNMLAARIRKEQHSIAPCTLLHILLLPFYTPNTQWQGCESIKISFMSDIDCDISERLIANFYINNFSNFWIDSNCDEKFDIFSSATETTIQRFSAMYLHWNLKTCHISESHMTIMVLQFQLESQR
jgi:hypothetical protein